MTVTRIAVTRLVLMSFTPSFPQSTVNAAKTAERIAQFFQFMTTMLPWNDLCNCKGFKFD